MIKKIIKNLLPYGLVELYWSIKAPKRSCLKGVYKSFDDVDIEPARDFVNDKWIKCEINKAKGQLQSKVLKHVRLNLLLNLLTNRNKVDVYDVGGSIGHVYFDIYHHLQAPERLRWKIFELPSVISAYSEFIKSIRLPYMSIANIEDLVIEKNDNLKVLYMSSVLQYMDKPFIFLKNLLPNVNFIFLTRLLASPTIPTFVSKQYLYVGCPVRLFNLGDILNFLRGNNFEVIEVWDEAEKAVMKGVPPKFRLDHCRGILAENRGHAVKPLPSKTSFEKGAGKSESVF